MPPVPPVPLREEPPRQRLQALRARRQPTLRRFRERVSPRAALNRAAGAGEPLRGCRWRAPRSTAVATRLAARSWEWSLSQPPQRPRAKVFRGEPAPAVAQCVRRQPGVARPWRWPARLQHWRGDARDRRRPMPMEERTSKNPRQPTTWTRRNRRLPTHCGVRCPYRPTSTTPSRHRPRAARPRGACRPGAHTGGSIASHNRRTA